MTLRFSLKFICSEGGHDFPRIIVITLISYVLKWITKDKKIYMLLVPYSLDEIYKNKKNNLFGVMLTKNFDFRRSQFIFLGCLESCTQCIWRLNNGLILSQAAWPLPRPTTTPSFPLTCPTTTPSCTPVFNSVMNLVFSRAWSKFVFRVRNGRTFGKTWHRTWCW